jgi:hypothetical protein
MTHMATFPVTAALPLPADDDVLLLWSAARLRDCEEWLTRRYPLVPPADLLAEVRSRHAQGCHDRSLTEALAELADRRARILAAGPGDGALCDLIGRLSHDLALYQASLDEGGFSRLRVVPTAKALVPLFLPEPGELFLPQWLLPKVPEYLFGPGPLFPDPPKATTSWLFFQSLALATGPLRAPTLASFYGIRESD